MERITRYYIGRVNVTNGNKDFINSNSFNGLPSAQPSIDDARGFSDRTDARTAMYGLTQFNKGVKGNYEYYEVIRDETTRKLTDQLSDEAKRWFEEQSEEGPPTEEGTTEEGPPTEEGTTE